MNKIRFRRNLLYRRVLLLANEMHVWHMLSSAVWKYCSRRTLLCRRVLLMSNNIAVWHLIEFIVIILVYDKSPMQEVFLLSDDIVVWHLYYFVLCDICFTREPSFAWEHYNKWWNVCQAILLCNYTHKITHDAESVWNWSWHS